MHGWKEDMCEMTLKKTTNTRREEGRGGREGAHLKK